MTFKLLATIEQAFSKLHKGGNDHPLPQQLTFELPKNRPFLSGSSLQALYPQACFFNREGRKFWGVGALKRYNSRSELANGIKQLNRDKETTDQWIIGGRSFTGLPTSSSEWREYGEYLFFLPRFALEQDSNGQGHLTINFQDETVAILPRLYEQLTTLLTSNPTATMPNSTRLEYLPGQEEFEQLVNQGVDQIIQNKLQKYVLARKVVKDFDAPIPYDSVVQQLMEQKRPGSYLLFIAPSPQSCFISQTPEQLFSLNDDHLLTEALAGSRPAGRSPQADQQLGAELLDSAKDATEHQLVNQHLDMVLAKFCHSHRSVAKRELLNLGYIQHLRTRWEGRVIKHFNLLDFLDQIHPTPALGGIPLKPALEIIEDQEHFPRGLYGSPIGIISSDYSELAVGIRSLLIDREQMHLFAGVGVVAKSQGALEWQESKEKLHIFSDIL